jgi:putative transposase
LKEKVTCQRPTQEDLAALKMRVDKGRAIMKKNEHLEPGKYYHIYNCGINSEDLFKITDDYERFLRLFEKYISPIAETYAWVLMKNHFHLMVKIKQNLAYKYSNDDGSYDKEQFNEIKWETVELPVSNADRSGDAVRFERMETCQRPTQEDLAAFEGNLIPKPHLHFSHLFNAYAKYYNKKYKRHGTLFERQFKRKEVDNRKYFRSLVVYIHQNPVHHGFCEHPLDYGWSSYITCISLKPTNINRKEVIGWFDNIGNFKILHENKVKIENIEEYLEF